MDKKHQKRLRSRRINFLMRVAEVQEIVFESQKRGATLSWIYRNKIEHQFHISKSTFDNYLGIRAKAELKKIEEIHQNQ